MFLKKRNFVIFIVLVLSALLPTRLVQADTGPKPRMDFIFKQELPGDELTIVSASLYTCDLPDCSDNSDLGQYYGSWSLICTSARCYSIDWRFQDYNFLEIKFSDGVIRRSNIFETGGYDSRYRVTVRQSDLFVEKRLFYVSFFSIWTYVALCVICLSGIVIFIMAIISRKRHKKQNL